MLDIPAQAGLYIVTVACDEPISLNAHDPRIADKCIFIDRRHCKFGRARNLCARHRNYQRTFFPYPVNFRVVALLDNINVAEAACAAKLKSWRVRGRTGRLNEWLAGITPAEVEAIVIDTLTGSRFAFQRLT